MKERKYLTKSKFKIGQECANKLFYLDKPEYPNTKNDNDFLKALADGGFQVGELAKIYHPKGVSVDTLNYDEALSQTNELLKLEKVTIFEAAIKYKNFFIRIDILEKSKNSFVLTEVKSSTFDPDEVKENGFFTKKGTSLSSGWIPYLMDIAFQKFVLENAFSSHNITSNLMLLDKSKSASVDALNQRFIILPKEQKGTRIKVADGTDLKSVGIPLLKSQCVDNEVNFILNDNYEGQSFAEYATLLSKVYISNEFAKAPVSNGCKACEYRIPLEAKTPMSKSGFEECFEKLEKIKPENMNKPFAFDIVNFWRKVPELLANKQYFAEDVDDEDVDAKPRKDGPGWSQSERQLIQAESTRTSGQNVWFLREELALEIKSWNYPYHFIDFETARSAIPFNAGRRPYEQIGFQYSHHMVTKDGRISHQSQFINMEKGKFPNFEFVRALKKSLENDSGTIFRYHHHENTVLREIRKQLVETNQTISDKDELLAFIDSITKFKNGRQDVHGPRAMVDLCEVVALYYFHKKMGGRTSIKKVFPAILHDSKYLQDKYSKSLSDLGISSLARGNFILVKKDNLGNILDPYAELPSVFEDMDVPDEISVDDELKEGGAAMTAYARLQFSEVSDSHGKKIIDALLRYCELDTLAMVVIWDYFANDLLKR